MQIASASCTSILSDEDVEGGGNTDEIASRLPANCHEIPGTFSAQMMERSD